MFLVSKRLLFVGYSDPTSDKIPSLVSEMFPVVFEEDTSYADWYIPFGRLGDI